MNQSSQQAVSVPFQPSLSSHLHRQVRRQVGEVGEVAKVHVGIGECSQKAAANMTPGLCVAFQSPNQNPSPCNFRQQAPLPHPRGYIPCYLLLPSFDCF